jgi:hypothetical protein
VAQQRGREQLPAEIRADADRDARRVLAADFLEVAGDALALVQHHPRPRHQRTAEGRERDAARAALEELDAEHRLEALDALRERGLADVQQRGRAAQVAGFGRDQEALELDQVHAWAAPRGCDST